MNRMNTPWGTAQTQQTLAEGIISVSTASHGGLKLDRKRNAKMPKCLRIKGGWYEEDSDWNRVYLVFFAELGYSEEDKKIQACKQTLADWQPALYEEFYGVTLSEGQSQQRDRDNWYQENQHKLLSYSARSQNGMVKVWAAIGGRTGNSLPKGERQFLVPSDEYDNRTYAFVVDPTRHQEVQ